MKIYLHGIKGRLHSWTDKEYISQWFVYQRRELLGHVYQTRVINVKKHQMEAFLNKYGVLKLYPMKIREPDSDSESELYVLEVESLAINERCVDVFLQLAELKVKMYGLGLEQELTDAIDIIAPEVPFIGEECVMFSQYQLLGMMNTLRIAKMVLDEEYREM